MRRGAVLATIASALLLGGACATSDGVGQPDGGGDNPTLDASPPVDAAPPVPDAAAPVMLTQSISQIMAPTNTVMCHLNTIHAENSFYRIYDLNAEGITGDFDVTMVHFGVETATAGSGGMQPLTVNVHTLTGAFVVANLTQIATMPMQIPDGTLQTFDVPISVLVPAGSRMVLELLIPDGGPGNNSLFPGSNASGQTAPTYIRASDGDCMVTQPTDMASVPNGDTTHLILNVTGTPL